MPPPAGDSDGEDGHGNGAESPASPDSAFGAVFQSDHSDLESSSDPGSDVDANGDRSQLSPRANDGRPPSSSESNDDASEPSSEPNDDASEPSSDADDDRGRRRPAGFFDLEAEDDQDSDMGADGDDNDEDDDDQDLIQFPQFSRFPPELRRMVWEAYCPDLTSTQGRVYDIMAPSQRLALNVTLPQRTLAARTVLAVNHESRTWALQAFPDGLTLPSAPGDVLRFDKHKDIVIFNHVAEPLFRDSVLQQVHNLAVGADLYDTLEDLPLPGSPEMPNLAQIFFTVDARECRVQDTLTWCASKPAIFSSPVTFVEDIDGRESTHLYQYCWPDIKEWKGFTGRESELAHLWGTGNIPFPRLYQDQEVSFATGAAAADDSDDDSQTSENDEAERTRLMVRDLLEQVPIYPLLLFQDEKIVRNIQSWNGDPDTWLPEFGDEDGYFWRNDDSVGSLTEEYDSSGIDDSDIEERSHGDEDEDDLDLDLDLDDVDESDHLGLDGESEEVSGDESSLALAPAHFSSPESTTVRGDSTSTDGEQGEEPGPRGHSGSQTAISIEDDSNDDSDEVAPRKRKRATRSLDVSSSSSDGEGPMQRSRKRRIISDDSDSADSAPRKRARRATIVTDSGDSDTDDDQVMETSEVAPKKKDTGRRTNPIELSESESASGSDGSSPSGSEEDDDAPPTKPMTLAERLALNRRENPIPISDSEDGEDNGSSMQEEEEGDEEDHDGGAVGEYAYGGRFPDDDEGNDDSSAQEEAQEGGIFDEESDGGY